jgi:hypothetical protein
MKKYLTGFILGSIFFAGLSFASVTVIDTMKAQNGAFPNVVDFFDVGSDTAVTGNIITAGATVLTDSGYSISSIISQLTYPLTSNYFVATSTATSTFAGGLYGSLISAPYFHATSTTATSTFAGGLNVKAINQTGTATSTFASGIQLASGCFRMPDGSCLTSISATWTSETPSGSVNGSNVTFTLAGTPISNSLSLYLNGVEQTPGGVDYTLSGTIITFATAPVSGAVYAHYQTGSATWVEASPSGTINGSNVTFTLASTPTSNSLSLYLNGVLQTPNVDYTLSGTTITFTTAPVSGALWGRWQT